MTRTPHLTSDTAACCWIPLFALRCETARRPELASLPLALLAPDDTRRLWQVAPLARRAGVKPGMTVSQAIGLCPALKLCEPDPVHYDEQFARLVAALVTVSPVVEPVELGRGGEVPRLPAARRAPARPRHAPPAAAARRQDAGRARRAAGGSRRVAVRPRRPAAVAARGGTRVGAGGGTGGARADRGRPDVFYSGR